jgi:hypothetical protein
MYYNYCKLIVVQRININLYVSWINALVISYGKAVYILMLTLYELFILSQSDS